MIPTQINNEYSRIEQIVANLYLAGEYYQAAQYVGGLIAAASPAEDLNRNLSLELRANLLAGAYHVGRPGNFVSPRVFSNLRWIEDPSRNLYPGVFVWQLLNAIVDLDIQSQLAMDSVTPLFDATEMSLAEKVRYWRIRIWLNDGVDCTDQINAIGRELINGNQHDNYCLLMIELARDWGKKRKYGTVQFDIA